VEALLFDGFIPAAYRHGLGGRWKAQDAEKWLTFLAHHLEYTIGSPDLAWWQLGQALTSSPLGGPSLDIVSLVLPVAVAVPVLMVRTAGLLFLGGLPPPDASSAASPLTVLSRSRRVAIVGGAVAAAVSGAVFGVGAGVVAGVAAGAVGGVVRSFLTPWPWYEIARIWLALRHRLPWQLLGFLADAHRRGVLRQVGAVYQFRHIELQRRLAPPTLRGLLGLVAWPTGQPR
jgi:hypothetical protein